MDLIRLAYQDLSENIEQPNESNSSTPTKRKRITQVRSESQNEQVKPDVVTIDDNLIGQFVCGVVEGSFDKGYFLNLKIKDSTKEFQGVFLPKKVTSITPANDLFPQVRMDARNDIPNPSLNQQTPAKGNKIVTWKQPDIASGRTLQEAIASSYTPSLEVLQNVENLTKNYQQRSLIPDLTVEPEEQLIPVQVKDVGGLSTEDKQILQPIMDSKRKDKFLQLMLMLLANDDKSKEYYTSKKPEDAIIELFPAFRKSIQQYVRSSFEEILNEEKLRRTEQQICEPCGRDLTVQTQASPIDIVPEELQTRLRPRENQTMSGSGIGNRGSAMGVKPCGHDFSGIMSEENVPEELQLRLWPLENQTMSGSGIENGGYAMRVEPCAHDFSRLMSEENVPEELQLRLWPLVDSQGKEKQNVQPVLDTRHERQRPPPFEFTLLSTDKVTSNEDNTARIREDRAASIVPEELQPRRRPLENQTMSGSGIGNRGHRRSHMRVEPCGHDFSRLMSEDNVPEELQLRLWPLVDSQVKEKQNLQPVLETRHERQMPPPSKFTLLSTNDVTSNEDHTARIPEDLAASKTVSLSNGDAARAALIESIPSLDVIRSELKELRKEEKLRRIQLQQLGIVNQRHKRKKLKQAARNKSQKPPAD